MAKLSRPSAPPCAQGDPLTPSMMFAGRDLKSIGEVYRAIAQFTEGDIKLLPVGRGGKPNWIAANRDTLEPPDGQQPTSMAEAARWCVLVDSIPACHPSTTMLVAVAYGNGAPILRHIAGPVEDKAVATQVLLRAIDMPGLSVPDIPDLIAANDDEAPDGVEMPLPPMHPAPWSPEAAGGLLGQTARWITDNAFTPVPELSLAAAVALMAGLFGDKALGPTASGVNVFLCTLLATAGGKAHPAASARKLADAIGRAGVVSNGDPTSYAAIERMLRKNRSTVIVLDEFGILLQDVNGRNRSAPSSSIRKFLLQIYDQANAMFDGRTYASAETKKDDGPIDGPALTALGMTTPSTLYDGLSEASVKDGFVNRFLFVSALPPAEIKVPRLRKAEGPPVDLVEAFRDAWTSFPKVGGNLSKTKYQVPFEGGEDGDAYRRWGAVYMWQHHADGGGRFGELAGRAAENTVRLATLRAISRAPSDPTIVADDVEWGWAIVHRSLVIVRDGIDRHMAASPTEALRKAILEALREAKDHVRPYSKLMTCRGVSGADLRSLEDALRWLIEAGQITDLNAKPKPGPGSKFRSNVAGTALE